MKAQSLPHLSVTIFITILAALLATLGSILGNIATSSIPSFLLPYVRFAWPALGVIFLLGLWGIYLASAPRCSSIFNLVVNKAIVTSYVDFYSCSRSATC